MTITQGQFDSMSPAARRAAIAEDVIIQLRSGRYTANHREGYLLSSGPIGNLQEFLARPDECRVCAIGGLLASKARIADRIDCGERQNVDLCMALSWLKEEFSPGMLMVVEEVYESNQSRFVHTVRTVLGKSRPKLEHPWWSWPSRRRRTEVDDRADAMREALGHEASVMCRVLGSLEPATRMEWIMRNIADNGGSLVIGGLRWDG